MYMKVLWYTMPKSSLNFKQTGVILTSPKHPAVEIKLKPKIQNLKNFIIEKVNKYLEKTTDHV